MLYISRFLSKAKGSFFNSFFNSGKERGKWFLGPFRIFKASCLSKRSTSESRQHGSADGGTRYEQNFLAGEITASTRGKQRAII
jgi:hypothetical protein